MSTPAPRRSRAVKAALPSKTLTGAAPAPSTVAEVICPAAPRRSATIAHQTHGAVTPMTGPITSVSQLTNGGRNVAKGSAGSFETMAAYTSYLKGLNLHDLRRHAREDAHIVPIDDRDRLIRRLETAWTSTAAKYPGRPGSAIPTRVPFTAEQIAAQAAIRDKLVRF